MDPAPRTSTIALVVATHRRPDALEVLLRSVERQSLEPARFEVAVVVDGQDETGTAYRRVLEHAQLRASYPLAWEFQDNAGQSVARERGIRMTSAPWLCVVDDDMDLAPAFLEAHVRALGCGPARTAVVGRVVPEPGWERQPLYEAVRTYAMLELHDRLAAGAPVPGEAFVTQNVSFTRLLYRELGGFDPSLRLGEDTDLGLRIELAGATLRFADDAAAVHRSRIGAYDTWLRRCVEYGRNGVYIWDKLGHARRVHPLRNLVDGSRLNAAAVHLLSSTDERAHRGIERLRRGGARLQRLRLTWAAIATHKAILAVAYNVGVRQALGSWRQLLDEERAYAAGAPSR